MILTKLGQHVNEMMAVVVKNIQNFWSRFLIIRQNGNMATNAVLYCGLAPNSGSRGHKHGYKMLICLYFGRCC